MVLGRTCGGKGWSSLRQRQRGEPNAPAMPIPLSFGSGRAGSGEKLKRAESLSGEWIEIYAKGMHNNGSIRAERGGWLPSEITPPLMLLRRNLTLILIPPYAELLQLVILDTIGVTDHLP